MTLFHGKRMKRFCFALFTFSFLLTAEASVALPPDKTALPERIVLNLTKHPSTTQAVTWRTAIAVSHPQAQITPATGSPNLGDACFTANACTETVKLDDETTVYYHSVVFESLRPQTLYAYRVGDGNFWSEWNQFKTAADTHRAFGFVYFGDIQNDILSLSSRIFRTAYKKAPDAAFWLFVGDLVNDGNKDEEWSELFSALGWIPRVTPIILLPGNHEYPDKRFVRKKDLKLHKLWRPQFTLPQNGPEGLDETVYYIDYQGVRIVMLNGNEKLDEQAIWLKSVLSENPHPWTIAAIHQPFYSGARNRDKFHSQKLFCPILDQYSVDLVLQGHDHIYSRTCKLRNGRRVPDHEKGTVYVVSVSGSKSYSIEHGYGDRMVKAEAGRQLFQVIQVDEHCLHYESFNALGELCDSFELNK
jgi:acid phosphatase type 7